MKNIIIFFKIFVFLAFATTALKMKAEEVKNTEEIVRNKSLTPASVYFHPEEKRYWVNFFFFFSIHKAENDRNILTCLQNGIRNQQKVKVDINMKNRHIISCKN